MARAVWAWYFLAGILIPAQGGEAPEPTSVRPETLSQFYEYIRKSEARTEREIRNPSLFLWSAQSPERLARVRKGEVVVEPASSSGQIEITGGLIHDWTGAVFIPEKTLAQVLTLVQDYDSHKRYYQPEVIDSRILSRSGNEYRVYLRLLKKKVLTVVLNTEHHVRYQPIGARKCYSRSYSTRIAEVENPGKPGEKERPPGRDHGFLWRLNSYWRFEEKDGGVFVECQAVSLTRDIPPGLGWLINPIVGSLPRESLVNTLRATRDALQQAPRSAQELNLHPQTASRVAGSNRAIVQLHGPPRDRQP